MFRLKRSPAMILSNDKPQEQQSGMFNFPPPTFSGIMPPGLQQQANSLQDGLTTGVLMKRPFVRDVGFRFLFLKNLKFPFFFFYFYFLLKFFSRTYWENNYFLQKRFIDVLFIVVVSINLSSNLSLFFVNKNW